jgi:cysteine desulfurase / selenocysteine lyase
VGAELRYVDLDDDFRIDLDSLDRELERGPKLVAFTHVSNVLGTVNPVAEIARRAHAAGARVLVDASQSVPHLPVDVQALGADFVAFTGHKMLGPTGIGALWARRALLEAMPPFMGGGDMIRSVTFERSQWNEVPWKFEAGTMPIAEVIGLGAAVDWLERVGMDAIWEHDRALVAYALPRIAAVPGVRVIGPAADRRGALVAFTLDGIHAHDVATVLDADGVAVRAGHHCAMPLHQRLGLAATARASFHCYTTEDDVDALVRGLHRAREVFG